MSVAERSMGFGLKALRNIAQFELIDRVGLRKPVERAISQGAKSGFRAASTAGRTFAAVSKRGAPVRQTSTETARKGLFDLTASEEQEFLQEAFGDFATKQLRPAAQAADAACAAPPELLGQAMEQGASMLGIPDELGGAMSEASAVTTVLVAEKLAHGDMGLAFAALAPGAVGTAISLWGDAEQQARYLPPFVGDDVPAAALAMLEPRALFDPFALKTTARRTDDGYILDGVKSLVPRAAECELFVVAADLEAKGPALFIVEGGAATGMTTTPEPAMGLRAAATGALTLDSVTVPTSALLGDGDPKIYSECVWRARIAWCALATGTAQAVLDYLIPYVNERIAFGEPISHRQSVAFAVSDVAIESDGMRLATYRAAARADAGKEFGRDAAMARSLCSKHGMEIGSDGVQLLGGHGYIKEHPVERWYRDLRAAGVMEGALLV